MLTEMQAALVPDQHTTHGVTYTFWALGIVGSLLVFALIVKIYQQCTHSQGRTTFSSWINFIVKISFKPCLLLVASYLTYSAFLMTYLHLPRVFLGYEGGLFLSLGFVLRIIELVAFFWFILNFLSVGKTQLYGWLVVKEYRSLSILLPMLSKSLQAAIILLMVNMLIPELGLDGVAAEIFEKSAKVLLIGVLGWIFVQMVESFSQLILNQYRLEDANSTISRKINTQVTLLKRIIITIGFIVIIASILMVFDSVKRLGAGLLTTAGIISAVGAFASQQSLSRLFAGLQIAFTQPIRIGDTVIIEGEFGQIEEITLSYVVVKLWDLRRLILPTDYLTNKGFQNLTRSSSELLGFAFLYVDYNFPVEDLRVKFKEFLSASTQWDGKVCALQVTDISENTIQIRALMSAPSAPLLFDLRCIMREKLLEYIVKNHYESLPKIRNYNAILSKHD